MGYYEEHKVNPRVLVWGGSQRAEKLARAIANQQPVVWAYRKPVPFSGRTVGIQTIWDKDLAYLKGKIGRFTVGLKGTEVEGVEVGAVILVPDPSRPVLNFPSCHEAAGYSVLVALMGVSRRTYSEALPEVLKLAERSRVWVVTDDIQTSFDGGEDLYTEARRRGVVFVRTDRVPSTIPIPGLGRRIEATVFDRDLGREVCLEADFLVAPVWVLGDDMSVYFSRLGLMDFDWGDYPGGTNREGIYIFPDPEGFMTEAEEETVIQALAAKVAVLARGRMRGEKRFEINAERCAYCLTCYRNCPHMAIEFRRDDRYANLYGEACFIDDLSCRGCGLCYALCPAQAITEIGTESLPKAKPAILACENAAGLVLKQAGTKYEYQLFPCAGAIGENEMLRVLAANGGKRDLWIVTCIKDKCEHGHQDMKLRGRVERLNKLLARLGIEARVNLMRMSAANSLSRFGVTEERT